MMDTQTALNQLVDEVSELVQRATGVQLGANQTNMVRFRLTKRISDLDFESPEEYTHYLRENMDQELKVLISLLTTHHTFFFREYGHFEYLSQTALPKVVEAARASGRKHLRIWSAASSRGQEAYSIAMFLNVHLKSIAPDFTYEILGSDVDHESVQITNNGVYRWDEIKEIPTLYLANNWVRGTGDIADFAKARPAVKDKCKFQTLNLFEISTLKPQGQFDIIFCRNVFIYFKAEQISQITQALLQHLVPTGYLMIGLSESLNGLKLPVASVGPSVYSHYHAAAAPAPTYSAPAAPTLRPIVPNVSVAAPPPPPPSPVLSSQPVAATPQNVRVLCVDDSGTVIALLKKVLSQADGFEVVATAENGNKAAEFLKANPGKIDVITLDIHMPECDGIEFLRRHYKSGEHPPVVMISSVSREDSSLGIKAFEYGATDYVEKPSLQNLAQRAEEIRMKLRLAARTAKTSPISVGGAASLVQSFAKGVHLSQVENRIRVIVGGLGDRDRIKAFLRACLRPQPPTIVLLHGSDNLLGSLVNQWNTLPFEKVEYCEEPPGTFSPNSLYICDFQKGFHPLSTFSKGLRTSILVMGDVPTHFLENVTAWEGAQIIVEDQPGLNSQNLNKAKEFASYCIPLTSFKYHSDEFLAAEERAA